MKHNRFKRLIMLMLVLMLFASIFSACSKGERKSLYASKEVQAVVETALAYLGRGSRIQYADTTLSTNKDVNVMLRYRWQTGKHSPEDATSQYLTYTNCAAFTHDVYYFGLGMDIPYTTARLVNDCEDWTVYRYDPTGKETEEEMAAMEKEFRSNLKVGDLIVIRYNGDKTGNGHAMLYVGSEILDAVEAAKNDTREGNNEVTTTPSTDTKNYAYDIIHSSGGTYNYEEGVEKFEEAGSISKTSVDALFDPAGGRYVFGKLLTITIIRPLDHFEGEIPETTMNRMKNMYGIMAEKLSSHAIAQSVNPGEELTYTFSITNTNAETKTVTVSDYVPEYTTYVSGADTVNGNALSWNVELAPGETKEVSYKVMVNADAPYGTEIYSESFVGGVPVNCKRVIVENSLTTDEQTALVAAVEKFATINVDMVGGFGLANMIYQEALGTGDLFEGTDKDIWRDLFASYIGQIGFYMPNSASKYAEMFVPTMYGGRTVLPDKNVEEAIYRSRLPQVNQLMVGDILFASVDAGGQELVMYLLNGDVAYDLLNGLAVEDTAKCLEKTISYNRYMILRPSMMMK